jgi:8-oxo-dGTP pyrophosphatase MutT (NUDIX family)
VDAAPAVDAATLLLVRDGAPGLEVLMLRRHADMVFAGALVFPGGSVDAADREAAGAARGDEPFRRAALRECYEEAHLLLVRRAGVAALMTGAECTALEAACVLRPPHFADLLAGGAIAPACDLLVPFARWVTPERAPRRYDTSFFLARAPADQVARPDGREAVAALWLTPDAAIAAADAQRERLVFATRMNLMRLAKSPDVASALAAAASCADRIVPMTPVLYRAPSGWRIRTPSGVGRELGYDEHDMATSDPAARAR